MSTRWLKDCLCLLAPSFSSNNARGIANRWLIRMHTLIAFISPRLFVIAEHSRAHTTGDASETCRSQKATDLICIHFLYYTHKWQLYHNVISKSSWAWGKQRERIKYYLSMGIKDLSFVHVLCTSSSWENYQPIANTEMVHVSVKKNPSNREFPSIMTFILFHKHSHPDIVLQFIGYA